jgi:hypothetical protein
VDHERRLARTAVNPNPKATGDFLEETISTICLSCLRAWAVDLSGEGCHAYSHNLVSRGVQGSPSLRGTSGDGQV